MVTDIQCEYGYTLATDSELNDLLAGKDAGATYAWSAYSKPPLLPVGATGVLWKKGAGIDDPKQPIALVAREDAIRRLCGRFAQIHSDVSPLTAWCHLISPELFESLQFARHEPDLGGFEAAWTGLIVAEAQLLSQKPLNELRISACLSTQSYAIARAKALWREVKESEVVSRFRAATNLSGANNDVRANSIRLALQPIWNILLGVTDGQRVSVESDLFPILESLEGLREARRQKDKDETTPFVKPLVPFLPEGRLLSGLGDISPEKRLRVFDQLIHSLSMQEHETALRKNGLALLAGYLITVAAGGTPTLSLAESTAEQLPEIMGWAYVVGGIGERVFWTSSFYGLGRLVARELMRPFRLAERPTCDFSLDEAAALLDPKLSDPLVYLRIKTENTATVALLPGVNISIAIKNSAAAAEARIQSAAPSRTTDNVRPTRNPISLFAEAIWPYLRPHVEELMRLRDNQDFSKTNYDSAYRRRSQQLPLKGSKK
jgi:hypothetical protein